MRRNVGGLGRCGTGRGGACARRCRGAACGAFPARSGEVTHLCCLFAPSGGGHARGRGLGRRGGRRDAERWRACPPAAGAAGRCRDSGGQGAASALRLPVAPVRHAPSRASAPRRRATRLGARCRARGARPHRPAGAVRRRLALPPRTRLATERAFACCAQFDAAIELFTRAMRPPLEPWADATLSVKRSGAFARCVCAWRHRPSLRPLQSASSRAACRLPPATQPGVAAARHTRAAERGAPPIRARPHAFGKGAQPSAPRVLHTATSAPRRRDSRRPAPMMALPRDCASLR